MRATYSANLVASDFIILIFGEKQKMYYFPYEITLPMSWGSADKWSSTYVGPRPGG
jgi:hypothetical protein